MVFNRFLLARSLSSSVHKLGSKRTQWKSRRTMRAHVDGKAREPCRQMWMDGHSYILPIRAAGYWNDIPCHVISILPNGIVCERLPQLTRQLKQKPQLDTGKWAMWTWYSLKKAPTNLDSCLGTFYYLTKLKHFKTTGCRRNRGLTIKNSYHGYLRCCLSQFFSVEFHGLRTFLPL